MDKKTIYAAALTLAALFAAMWYGRVTSPLHREVERLERASQVLKQEVSELEKIKEFNWQMIKSAKEDREDLLKKINQLEDMLLKVGRSE